MRATKLNKRLRANNYPLYDHPRIESFEELIDLKTRSTPKSVAFLFIEKRTRISVTYEQFGNDVRVIRALFKQMGLAGKTVALLGENSYCWILAYFAIVMGHGIVVPIDKELGTDDIGDLLGRCGASAIACSAAYTDVGEELCKAGTVKESLGMSVFSKFLNGEKSLDGGELPSSDAAAVCSILFTSGTTGQPKGVMLTQRGLMTDAVSACQNLCVHGPSLLTLPLHHAFGFTVGVLAELVYGYPICISRSLKTFKRDMLEFRPQNMILVPLYVEAMYKNIWQAARESGRDRRLKTLIVVSNLLRKLGVDVRKRLFQEVIDKFGGELSEIVCGGAFLDQRLINGMDDVGIQVLNGYGITECSPVVSVNRNEYRKAGSVGLPLSACEVKVVDDEIYVRGDVIMAGYCRDGPSTAKAMDGEWFRTGDLGYVDEDGFLFVTGRKKNLIVLSNGKNVSPEELEEKIVEMPGVREVVVFGHDDRIAAEVYASDSAEVKRGILLLNRKLPAYKRIQEIEFRDEPFAKTSTQKIKRRY